ncbi:unnamed protein product [Microthlaspi erraticum]|uniref:Uncharacterized protein n=1 Tax=Microthlaspi erraticum TaxID=1685480 RepID=A0A6D2KIJ7_9BRAS|nr:unnamed protein product [Microthlaspi erraticum]
MLWPLVKFESIRTSGLIDPSQSGQYGSGRGFLAILEFGSFVLYLLWKCVIEAPGSLFQPEVRAYALIWFCRPLVAPRTTGWGSSVYLLKVVRLFLGIGYYPPLKPSLNLHRYDGCGRL